MRSMRSSRSWVSIVLWVVGAIAAILVGIGVAGVIWYSQQLGAVDASDTSSKRVSIVKGSTPGDISKTLKESGVIKSPAAFLLYTRFEGVQGSLQAGVYRLSPSETLAEITQHLVKGNTDTLQVMFYPGAVLKDNTSKQDKQDITTSLRNAGFTDDEITAGLSADYSSYNGTLFQGKPSTADLEGYVYGDTYNLSGGATVEDALRASFDQFWKVIQENNLIEGYKKQNLTLYQGITLASIVQRESIGGDEAGIARVFFNRLDNNDQLGSDVTYQYIADKTGVPRDTNLDSPYNTRRYTGLTPGPIAVPGAAALKAVAVPATSDYYYFLSGDDDITYFAKTLKEHESNIVNHCRVKCQIL